VFTEHLGHGALAKMLFLSDNEVRHPLCLDR
jgi:hypothetical protein